MPSSKEQLQNHSERFQQNAAIQSNTEWRMLSSQIQALPTPYYSGKYHLNATTYPFYALGKCLMNLGDLLKWSLKLLGSIFIDPLHSTPKIFFGLCHKILTLMLNLINTTLSLFALVFRSLITLLHCGYTIHSDVTLKKGEFLTLYNEKRFSQPESMALMTRLNELAKKYSANSDENLAEHGAQLVELVAKNASNEETLRDAFQPLLDLNEQVSDEVLKALIHSIKPLLAPVNFATHRNEFSLFVSSKERLDKTIHDCSKICSEITDFEVSENLSSMK